jgi:LysM repeat protein
MKSIQTLQRKRPSIAGHRAVFSVLALTAAITLGLALGSAQAADSGARRHAQGGYDAANATYTVAEGDRLSAIAERFGTTIDAIKADNKLQSDEIGVGESLVLAAADADETSPSASAMRAGIPTSIAAPDKIETRIGALEFKDGVPTAQTARKVYDTLDFTRALNAYNNSFRGASALAIKKGMESIGAGSGDIVIFEELMDSSSLFLTANADTVYYLGWIDLSKGPVVIDQPSGGLGAINDMWFQWVIDIGKPGPDRGLGGKYLIVGPDYDGPLPEGGYFVAHARTNTVLYALRLH